MASVVLSGDTSGSITVAAPAVAGSTTQTLVNVTGTLAPVVSGTAVASTSGTSIDFTSIPSWVKRITVMFSGVSTSGTSLIQVQIGSGSVETTGYLSGAVSLVNGSSVNGANSTTGFIISGAGASTFVIHGSATISLIGSNLWAMNFAGGRSDAAAALSAGGSKTASGTLDRVRITTINGTDTFDAGTINILYE
jgi:hypothetical protein